jgi:large subunit ribosomal protein L20
MTQANRRKIFRAARGFFGRSSHCWTLANRAVHHAWQYGYISRRLRKRDYRSEWIMRINAGARQFGVRYSELVRFLPSAGVEMNRRMLAILAATEPFSFRALVETARRQQTIEAAARGALPPIPAALWPSNKPPTSLGGADAAAEMR